MNPHADSVQQPSDDEERAAFEAWRRATTNVVTPDRAIARDGFGDDANYAHRATQSMWIGWKGRAIARFGTRPAAEPMFWVRLCRDGLYEGPVHHKSVGGKMLRDEKPGEWHPLYLAPTPAEPQALLGWTRYEKARKLNVAQWAELHQRNLRGENFDNMIDALPATTMTQQEGWTYDKNGSGKWEPVQQDTKALTKAQFYDMARAVMRVYRDRNPPRYLNDEQASASDSDFIGKLAECHDEAATPPAEKQAASSGEDNHG